MYKYSLLPCSHNKQSFTCFADASGILACDLLYYNVDMLHSSLISSFVWSKLFPLDLLAVFTLKNPDELIVGEVAFFISREMFETKSVIETMSAKRWWLFPVLFPNSKRLVLAGYNKAHPKFMRKTDFSPNMMMIWSATKFNWHSAASEKDCDNKSGIPQSTTTVSAKVRRGVTLKTPAWGSRVLRGYFALLYMVFHHLDHHLDHDPSVTASSFVTISSTFPSIGLVETSTVQCNFPIFDADVEPFINSRIGALTTNCFNRFSSFSYA